MTTQTCTNCNKTLPVSDFYVHKRGDKKYIYKNCKQCHKAICYKHTIGDRQPVVYGIWSDHHQKYVYVGMTETKLRHRISVHHNRAFQRNDQQDIYKAFRKYGKDNFRFDILDDNPSSPEVEGRWVVLLETFTRGFNSTIDGRGGGRYAANYSHKNSEYALKGQINV